MLALGLAATAVAQEGHPLTGSWHGDWGSGATRNHLVFSMHYEQQKVVGIINPGRNSLQIQTVTIDPAKWTVHLEAEGKDRAGKVVKVVADGKLDNLGSYNRTLTGTWQQGGEKGEFKITRD